MNMRCIASSNESNTNLMASNEMLFRHYWTWAGSVPVCECVCVYVLNAVYDLMLIKPYFLLQGASTDQDSD